MRTCRLLGGGNYVVRSFVCACLVCVRCVCVCECECGTLRAVTVGTSSHQVVVPSVPSGVVAGFEM